MSDSSVIPLLEWAEKNGAKINSALSFKVIPGRGLSAVANAAVDPSVPNISIPESIIIHPEQAKKCFGVDLQDAKDINSITKHFVNYQRSLKEESFWFTYLDILPEGELIGSPVYWSPTEKTFLQGTNLGSSLPEFFDSFVEEWFDSVKLIPSKFRDDNYDENLKFYEQYHKIGQDELYDKIRNYNIEDWTSFPCYLWSSMIFKSRSFPYILCNEDADPKYSMLLPVIDLLNHDPESYVSWVFDKLANEFLFNNNLSSVLKVGEEIFNNYGKKGNEELLMGYGFVLQDNKSDSLLLRIKVPMQVLPLIEKFGIQLPRLEDYTTSKYNLKTTKKPVDYKDYEKGLLYFCNQETPLPLNLLNLFGYLVKNEIEQMMSLRMRLEGLVKLRSAVEQKLITLDNTKEPTVESETAKKATIYRQGQRDLITKVISSAKDSERRILKDQKSKVWDLKKILKKDSLFANSLLLTFGLTGADMIEEQSLQDQVFLLWLIRCYNRTDEEFLPQWIQNLFQQFIEKVPVTSDDNEAFKDLHNFFFPALATKIPEIYSKGLWGLKELVISGKLLQMISYTRGSKDSIILVEPVAIAL